LLRIEDVAVQVTPSSCASALGWGRWSARGGLRSVRRSFAGAGSPTPRARPLLPCASRALRPTGPASLGKPRKARKLALVQPAVDLPQSFRSPGFLTHRRSTPTPGDSTRLEQKRREVPSAKAFRPSRPVQWQRLTSRLRTEAAVHPNASAIRAASGLSQSCPLPGFPGMHQLVVWIDDFGATNCGARASACRRALH